ncbi:hypothetical protein P4E94_14805 [Pontiellaceae bacterium B12219]|nr:hypothetical protein [Pontiellaceae bacterium B12219]
MNAKTVFRPSKPSACRGNMLSVHRIAQLLDLPSTEIRYAIESGKLIAIDIRGIASSRPEYRVFKFSYTAWQQSMQASDNFQPAEVA